MTNDFFRKEKKTEKLEEGLPEVAQKQHKKNPIVLVILALFLAAIFSIFFYTKSNKKIIQPIEESYTLQSDNTKYDSSSVQTAKTTAQPTVLQQPLTQEQIAILQEKQRALQQRLTAPLLLVSNSSSEKTSATTTQANSGSYDPNMQFMNQVSKQSAETAMATTIGPLKYIIAQGGLIHAILEPATNSDLPGFVRAIVSEPNYSEDGTNILIPRGSRLIGQYKSGMLQGQSRIFVVWTRLITPSGISINIGSPGVDSLGVAGMGADEINRHFWERFGTATLLSIIGAGAANVGVSDSMQDN